MKTQSKVLAPFAAKAVNTEARTFTGLASTWELDLGGDIIHRGAFAETIAHWKSDPGRVVPLIDHHRYGSAFDVLGKMTEAEETDEGLLTTFEVVPGDDGDRLMSRIKGGYLNGLSIGYQSAGQPEYEDVERADGVKESVRHLRRIRLFEVSAVIWGMNPGALIDTTSAKSLWPTLDAAAKQDLRAMMDAEAKAEADSAKPSYEREDELRQRILALKLRQITARSGGWQSLAPTT